MYNRYLAIDVETIADPSALPLLEQPPARKGLVDPAKVAADEKAKAEALRARMSLDPYAGRICCAGWQTEDMKEPDTALCRDEQDETEVLDYLAPRIATDTYQAGRRVLIGYNVLGFDWPFIAARARLLGVRMPVTDTRKYNNRDICDVWAVLTQDGLLSEGALRRTLAVMAKRFGIPHDDTVSGKDVAALWAAGEHEKVRAHCASDVALTVALARRLHLIPTPAAVEAF